MRLLQHKTEAYWFYRVLSLVYDRWVNPLFWTPAMRTRALAAAALDDRALRTLDAGAGTGFTTEGIVALVDAERVTMLDQSPHQLARARAKPALAPLREAARRRRGACRSARASSTATSRPAASSTGPTRSAPSRRPTACCASGGRALVIGPVRPANAVLRALADAWMLFPTERQYREWFERAGFADVELLPLAPSWYRSTRAPYAVAVSGRKPAPGPSPLALPPPRPPSRAARPHGAPLRRRLARRRGVPADRRGARAAPAAAGAARAVTTRAHAQRRRGARGPRRRAVALHAPAHGHRHGREHRRAVRDRGRRRARLRRRRPARRPRLDAARRLLRERLHRRRQPARGHRDRPRQQAVPAARGGRADGRRGAPDRRGVRDRAGRAGALAGRGRDRRGARRARGRHRLLGPAAAAEALPAARRR